MIKPPAPPESRVVKYAAPNVIATTTSFELFHTRRGDTRTGSDVLQNLVQYSVVDCQVVGSYLTQRGEAELATLVTIVVVVQDVVTTTVCPQRRSALSVKFDGFPSNFLSFSTKSCTW